jgi:two-component system chemotaxis sensor kinase CheA
MSLDPAFAAFEEESREMLAEMESNLLAIEGGGTDTSLINAIFRAAHTIKGSAGMFGLDGVVSFTHHVESVMDDARKGKLTVTSDLVTLMLRCTDHMAFLVAEGIGAETRGEDEAAREKVLLEELMTFVGGDEAVARRAAAKNAAAAAAPVVEAEPTPATGHGGGEHSDDGAGAGGDHDGWHVRIRFGPNVMREGMDPLAFIRYLSTQGQINWIRSELVEPGSEETFDPETCYIATELVISGGIDEASVRAVFDFIADQCELTVESCSSAWLTEARRFRPTPKPDHASEPSLPTDEPEVAARVDGNLAAPVEAAATDGARKAMARDATPQPQGGGAPAVGKAGDGRSAESRFLRVEADKLDQLINLIGELVIASAYSSLIAQRLRDAELAEAISTATELVESLRDTALNLRMVQIGATFSRFQRVVRDLSAELDKDVELVISGAETELDKSVVEKISDPLTHLVRNSLDHGLETRDKRVAAGKSPVGKLQLHAYHESGSIVIEVADDGGGLNSEKIRAKALERGLINANAALTQREINNLIFEPGFSTADTVTNISGRGVGMDVVKQNILGLRGSIDIESEVGVGTITRIRLPLTLAIIDGFLVNVAGGAFVVPLNMIVECLTLNCKDTETASGRNYVNLRGEVLPFVRLRDVFEKEDGVERRENIVVVNYAGRTAGLVVDELVGDFQTVIKPLGPLFKTVRGISGSTILGSGEVALILDVPALIELATRIEQSGSQRIERSML